MIDYVVGNLFDHTSPDNKKRQIVVHVVNNVGHYGGGFTAGLNIHFPEVREDYEKFIDSGGKLGDIFVTKFLDTETEVISMCAQNNTDMKKKVLVDYYSLAAAMCRTHRYIRENYGIENVDVVTIKFGAGIGSGDWSVIEQMINTAWHDINVIIYCQPEKKIQ